MYTGRHGEAAASENEQQNIEKIEMTQAKMFLLVTGALLLLAISINVFGWAALTAAILAALAGGLIWCLWLLAGYWSNEFNKWRAGPTGKAGRSRF